MSERIRQSENKISHKETTNESFQNGKLLEITLEDCPEEVRVYFDRYIKGYVHEGILDRVFVITIDNQGKVFVAKSHGKRVGSNGPSAEENLVLYEVRGGHNVGVGEIVNVNNDGENVTFVGNTRTNEKFQREGLGLKRLELMNTLAQSFWGEQLCSGIPNEAAVGVWSKLVESDRATYDEETKTYSFIQKQK